MTDYPTLLCTSTSEIPTLSYTWRLKRYSFRAEPSRIGHHREYPTPRDVTYGLLVQPVQGELELRIFFSGKLLTIQDFLLAVFYKPNHKSNWSYENRVSKHFVIFLNFSYLIASLLCCLLMSFFACCVVRDLCRSGCRQNNYFIPLPPSLLPSFAIFFCPYSQFSL